MNKKSKTMYVCTAVAVLICGTACILESAGTEKDAVGVVGIMDDPAVSAGAGVGGETHAEEDAGESRKAGIPVHIDGMVANPGVYYVDEGAIVLDVVELAGGGTDKADYSAVNLAQSVHAGMKIIIYSVQEDDNVRYADYGGAGEKLVNINTADKETLMTLPGIGESKAESIIKYRSENGGFAAKEEIMNISGIKTALYDRIKDKITT